MRNIFFLACTAAALQANAQKPAIEQVRAYRTAQERAIISDFFSFLQIPNVATDTANIGKNAAFIETMMRARGIGKVSLLGTDDKHVPPVVYGEVQTPGATRTIIFYAHYDGQPVNAALWAKGLHPFQPQLLNGRMEDSAARQPLDGADFPLSPDWRIYARGASDDKAGVMAILTAFDAIRHSGLKLSCNIKFFFEGEEEQGSTHLGQVLAKYKDQLHSDLWIICDGPVHPYGNKEVVFGARGDAHLILKVYGPKMPLHSGHYGNWVPNPVMQLSQLLASMKDSEGMVTVKGFYDDVVPLTATEKKALQDMPEADQDLKKKIGFAHEEMKGKKLAEAINLPSLNINGIESANIGTIQANVIPVSATAVVDLRLVLGNDWQRQQQKLIAHIRSQGFHVTAQPPTDEERSQYDKIVQVTPGVGDNAQRTSMDWPVARQVVAAVQQATPLPVLSVPTLGGSLPLEVLHQQLQAKTLIVPIANADNNQHAENENIRIANFREGIDIMASLLLMKLP